MKEFKNNVDEYLSLVNNNNNFNFLSGNKILPIKNLKDFKFKLPEKMDDSLNLQTFNKSKNKNQDEETIFELFLHKNINSYDELQKLYINLLNLLDLQNSNINEMNKLYTGNRRMFRINTKKHFENLGGNTQNLQKFCDNLIYLNVIYEDFMNNLTNFVKYLENFYIVKLN